MIVIDGIIEKLQNYGGISVYFQKLLVQLERNQIDYKYYTFDDRSHLLDNPNNIKLKSRFLERIRAFPLQHKGVIFHSTYYRCIKIKGVKSIVTLHDFTHEYKIPGIKSKIFSIQKYLALQNADAIICVSESTHIDMLNIYPELNKKRTVIIPNGISSEFRYLPTVKNKYEKPFFIFIGSRADYKRFDIALDALRILKDYSLVVVGGGKIGDNEVEKYIDLTDRLIIVEYAEEKELCDIYNEARFLLYPSEYEGFGIPIYEAMACGCPVVVSRQNPANFKLPEYIFRIDLNVELDLDKVLSSLIKTNKDKYLRQSIDYSKNFSWKKAHDLTLKLYQEFLT
jgi:mannosyltransferase